MQNNDIAIFFYCAARGFSSDPDAAVDVDCCRHRNNVAVMAAFKEIIQQSSSDCIVILMMRRYLSADFSGVQLRVNIAFQSSPPTSQVQVTLLQECQHILRCSHHHHYQSNVIILDMM
jgi:hypothetical protein